MEILNVELTPRLITVLESTRRDMLVACHNGLHHAEKVGNTIMVEAWQGEMEMEMIRGLKYEELHEMLVETLYRQLSA